MERLRQLLKQIQAQLGVLTTSQRVAIGLCAALIAGSILWLLQWSVEPEYVPLVKDDIPIEQVEPAEEALRGAGLNYELRGQRVYVRAEDKPNAQRLLHKAGVVTGSQIFDMEDLMTQSSPFESPEARQTKAMYALGNTLGQIIGTSPAIESARVVVNSKTKRRIGGPSDVPTASVFVVPAPGKEMTQEMVEWIGRLVSGAVSGLKPYNVAISDTRRSYHIPHPDEAVGATYLAETKKRERHLEDKILGQLEYIPGVRAAVSVELDTDLRSAVKVTYDKPQPSSEKEKEMASNAAQTPAEPGLQANTGTSLTLSPAGQTSSTEERTTEYQQVQITEKQEIQTRSFANKRVTATVGIPRSFVVSLFNLKYPDITDPTDDDLADEQSALVSSVTAKVVRLVQARDQSDVQVDVYPDLQFSAVGPEWGGATATMVAGAAAAEGPVSAMGMVRNYGPQAGLGLLALMSMFLMMRIVRRSSEEVRRLSMEDDSDEDDLDTILHVGPNTVGEAAASDSLLLGQEVDEGTLRYQQLNEEVKKMVQADPTGAADLIRRWVQEGDA
jgi:flagellar biosynthesis/type III secretory pathway M-ring protein FliF/YscJ